MKKLIKRLLRKVVWELINEKKHFDEYGNLSERYVHTLSQMSRTTQK